MKSKIALIVLCLFSKVQLTFAQQTLSSPPLTGHVWGDVEYENNKLNDMFSLVDKTQIPSGFLVQRGFYSDMPDIASITSMSSVDKFYPLLRKSYVGSGTNPVKPYMKWQDNLDSLNSLSSKISLSVFTIDIHSVKASSFSDGSAYVNSNERLVLTNPSTAYQLLNFCTAVPSKFTVQGSTFQFIAPTSIAVSNNSSIRTDIDFADNLGYRTVLKDQNVSVTYPSSGTKTIKVRFILGTTTIAETTFDLNVTVTSQQRTVSNYDDIFYVSATKEKLAIGSILESWPNDSKARYLLSFTGATVYEYLGCDGVRDKYCIVAEGVDANNELTATNTIQSGLTKYANIKKMVEDLLNEGYEVVYVDYNSGGDYIENNSLVLEKVIEAVNVRKNSNNSNIVIGVSMGGLVVRHCLRQMELKGKDHQTSVANYFDSPHLGANVPVGYQTLSNALLSGPSMIDKLTLGMIGPLKSVRETNHTLSCPASTQMLVRYLGSSPHPNYTSFQQQLANEGLPQNCRNVSIVNGSNNGTGQGFNPGDNLYNKAVPFIGLSLDVWGTYNGGSNMVSRVKEKFEIRIKVLNGGCTFFGKICWDDVYIGATFQQDLYSYTGYFDKCYDNAPGSTFESVSSGFKDQIGGTFPTGAGNFGFIPSVSSAYLKAPNASNLFYSLLNLNTQSTLSFFDKVYTYRTSNGPHIFDISTGSSSMQSTLSLIRTNEVMSDKLYVQNRTYSTNRDFTGRKSVTVGNNVTPNLSQGDVVIQNGSFIIKAGASIVIALGTTLKSGANVLLKIDEGLFAISNGCSSAANARLAEIESEQEEYPTLVTSTSTDLNEMGSKEYRSYPNPITSGPLHFGRIVESYSFTNSTGALIQQGNNADKLDVTGLPKGMYLLKLDEKTEKVIVQ